ncbi:MAG TPA: hypothetical protein VMI12_09615 [Puia sp.]|nr:hypothetical protein [Puia sp.]
MKYISGILSIALLLIMTNSSYAQSKRYDSTLKMGRVGFRVVCNNKNDDQNELSIRLIGFDHSSRDPDFYIKGRVQKSEIDDLNNDGFPDLVVYLSTGQNGIYGAVYAFASEQNKSVIPFALPDVMLDGKLNPGYKGHDEFSLMEGSLMQKFPLYKPGDEQDKPTGGSRVILYQMVKSENGGYKFKMIQSYDVK